MSRGLMMIVFLAADLVVGGCQQAASEPAQADGKTASWADKVGASATSGTPAVWPAGQIVYFPDGFPEGVKPWVVRIAQAVRTGNAQTLAPFVRQGDTAAAILAYWKQHSPLAQLYFTASYNDQGDSFTLADTAVGMYACAGTRVAAGYVLGSCRTYASTGASAGAGCTASVFSGQSPSTRVLLVGGDATTVFQQYQREAKQRGVKIDYGALHVFIINDRGNHEDLSIDPVSMGQMFQGINEQQKWITRLKGRTARTVADALQVGDQLRADVVCGG